MVDQGSTGAQGSQDDTGAEGSQGFTGPQGSIGNLNVTCSGGNTSMYINWSKPANSSTNVRYFYRIYKISPPEYTTLSFTGSGPYSLTINGLDANVEYTIDMYALDNLSSTPIVTKYETPVASNIPWNSSENLGDITVAITGAFTSSAVAGQSAVYTNTGSTGSGVTVTTDTDATIVSGNVLQRDVQTFINALPPGSTFLEVLALSTTPPTSGSISFNTTIRQGDCNKIIKFTIYKCINGGQITPVGQMTTTTICNGSNGATNVANLQVGNIGSIYIISYISEQSEQPVQCCIPTPILNQAYTNNLYTEKGRIERRENRILAGGYYRGPIDSSTLTRIRQGNGVILHQPGVDGGFRGSL